MKLGKSPGFIIVCAALPFFFLQLNVRAAEPPIKQTTAPPLRDCTVTATRDLGRWDDVFVPHNEDFMVLRRGDELFSLAMTPSAAPKKIARAPLAEQTQIVAGAVMDKRCWLFLNATRAAACAVDANSGTVAPFAIPGLNVPGSHAPGFQSCVIVPHAKSAILMVSGGDRATWPRNGNRPVYFWMDLRTGKTVRFPIGWDLDHFSANQRVAVFAAPSEKQFRRRPFRAVDMKTGERTDALPDLRKEPHVPFDWSDKLTVKPLYERREGKGDADFFAGLSVGGHQLPVDLGLDEVRYLSLSRAGKGFAGFRLRRSGASHAEPSPLWMVPFKDSPKAEVIATHATDFTMLGQRNALYVTVGQGRKVPSENRRHAEAFFHVHADRCFWNVLAGVVRLPELDKRFAGADFIVDRMRVELIEGFGGSRHDSLVLCLYEHHRGDQRALALGQQRLLASATWRRALLVTHDGRRYLTSLFREGNLPDRSWLHNSGKLLLGTYVWNEGQADRKRQVQLSECLLQMR